MIDECNKLRAENGLEPLKVSETALAMAMVQANYAANGHYEHNYQYDNVGENLNWGFADDDPYDGWYTMEKETYDAAVKSGDYPDLASLSAYDVFRKYPDLYYKVGHYLNIVNPDYIATGMAYSGYGETNYDHAFTQEYFNDWNSYNTHDTVYDAAVYRTMVENYVNQVRSAQSTYDEALKKVDEAKKALDKANQAKADTTAAQAAAALTKIKTNAVMNILFIKTLQFLHNFFYYNTNSVLRHSIVYLVFFRKNTFNGNVKLENGKFLSTKEQGSGIGIESVKYVVNKYNGAIEFKSDEETFSVSGVLFI